MIQSCDFRHMIGPISFEVTMHFYSTIRCFDLTIVNAPCHLWSLAKAYVQRPSEGSRVSNGYDRSDRGLEVCEVNRE